MRAAIDKSLSKVVSRKLLAWCVGTVALFLGDVDPTSWITLTCVYIGTQGVADIVATVRGTKRGDD